MSAHPKALKSLTLDLTPCHLAAADNPAYVSRNLYPGPLFELERRSGLLHGDRQSFVALLDFELDEQFDPVIELYSPSDKIRHWVAGS